MRVCCCCAALPRLAVHAVLATPASQPRTTHLPCLPYFILAILAKPILHPSCVPGSRVRPRRPNPCPRTCTCARGYPAPRRRRERSGSRSLSSAGGGAGLGAGLGAAARPEAALGLEAGVGLGLRGRGRARLGLGLGWAWGEGPVRGVRGRFGARVWGEGLDLGWVSAGSRHLEHHVSELCERIGGHGGVVHEAARL